MCPLKSALKMGAYQILILQPGYKNVSSGNVNPLKFEKKINLEILDCASFTETNVKKR